MVKDNSVKLELIGECAGHPDSVQVITDIMKMHSSLLAYYPVAYYK